jgi:hypothetical protein
LRLGDAHGARSARNTRKEKDSQRSAKKRRRKMTREIFDGIHFSQVLMPPAATTLLAVALYSFYRGGMNSGK